MAEGQAEWDAKFSSDCLARQGFADSTAAGLFETALKYFVPEHLIEPQLATDHHFGYRRSEQVYGASQTAGCTAMPG
jgi:hypothetical protein